MRPQYRLIYNNPELPIKRWMCWTLDEANHRIDTLVNAFDYDPECFKVEELFQ